MLQNSVFLSGLKSTPVQRMSELFEKFGLNGILNYLCTMETFRIEILNPKALRLLRDLADLELISINKTEPASFSGFLKSLRKKSSSVPSLDEISNEVEKIRSSRYGK